MTDRHYQWAVIGAGGAGIAAVGKLLDKGIAAKDILWIDPEFQVGDLGRYWGNVSSNTKVRLFQQFLEACHAFNYSKIKTAFALNTLPSEETCALSFMVEPLQWVSDQLCQRVTACQDWVKKIHLQQQCWTIQGKKDCYQARQVILAQGAEALYLDNQPIDCIPFEKAIDKDKLAAEIDINQPYAVYGSSHSAIMIIKHLVELGAKKVINFYRNPCRYAVDMGDWILFDNTGLKGTTASFAREYIDGEHPACLERYLASEDNIRQHLPRCHKAIYAVGFKRRTGIEIAPFGDLDQQPRLGILAPGLFGFGIAYPESKTDPFGNVESSVGLWKFMCYLDKVLPLWLKYSTQAAIHEKKTLEQFQ